MINSGVMILLLKKYKDEYFSLTQSRFDKNGIQYYTITTYSDISNKGLFEDEIIEEFYIKYDSNKNKLISNWKVE